MMLQSQTGNPARKAQTATSLPLQPQKEEDGNAKEWVEGGR